jgi:CO/xanthine dehydrogenase FAD-binding subunit
MYGLFQFSLKTFELAAKSTGTENAKAVFINGLIFSACSPKYLSNTCNFLLSKELTSKVLQEAVEVMLQEVAPISDARGTAAYKSLLLRQLFLAHFEKMGVSVDFVL